MPKIFDPGPLGEHALEYLHLLRALGRSMRTRESGFRTFALWLEKRGIRGITEVTADVLSAWRVEMAGRLHPRTLELRVGELRRFFLFLHSRGKIPRNPAETIPHSNPPRTSAHVFTVEEVRRLLKEGVAGITWTRNRGLEGFARLTAYTLFHLIYAAGLRRSEALGLVVRDLDLEERLLTIRKTKFYKERTIPIGRRAAQNLRAYLAERRLRQGELFPRDPVFAAPAHPGRPPGPMDGSVAWHFFHAMLVACGLRRKGERLRVAAGDKPHIHSLRHAFACHRLLKWYRDGADLTHKLFLLSAYMGHRGPDETVHYLRSTEAILAEAKGRFAGYLLPVR
jgi:integrase/recombinase XerD